MIDCFISSGKYLCTVCYQAWAASIPEESTSEVGVYPWGNTGASPWEAASRASRPASRTLVIMWVICSVCQEGIVPSDPEAGMYVADEDSFLLSELHIYF